MYVNHVLVMSRVGKSGLKLSYTLGGTPVCSLVVEVEERGKGAAYLPIGISGTYAENAAAEIEPGAEIQVIGKRHYQSVVDAKRQLNTSTLTRSTWGIHQRVAAAVRAAAQAHAWRGFNIIARR
jgi:hypothetical protein